MRLADITGQVNGGNRQTVLPYLQLDGSFDRTFISGDRLGLTIDKQSKSIGWGLAIVNKTEKDNFKLKALIREVILSDSFLQSN